MLPAVSPEEQYRFALGRALQNDLETAERAFSEFRVFNVGHERQADATFWLGRVQFMRGEYEKAAMTFSEFNSVYPVTLDLLTQQCGLLNPSRILRHRSRPVKFMNHCQNFWIRRLSPL